MHQKHIILYPLLIYFVSSHPAPLTSTGHTFRSSVTLYMMVQTMQARMLYPAPVDRFSSLRAILTLFGLILPTRGNHAILLRFLQDVHLLIRREYCFFFEIRQECTIL